MTVTDEWCARVEAKIDALHERMDAVNARQAEQAGACRERHRALDARLDEDRRRIIEAEQAIAAGAQHDAARLGGRQLLGVILAVGSLSAAIGGVIVAVVK